MNYVIGSGPSGIACAMALVQRGKKVTILDVGIELEQETQQTIKNLQRQPFETWNSELIEKIKGKVSASSSGVERKYAYGSDYAYREAQQAMSIDTGEFEAVPTFAKGGFSTVWGGAMLPYQEKEFATWPISFRDLEDHYKAVSNFVPISAEEDGLFKNFPVFKESPLALKKSSQAVRLLFDLHRNQIALEKAGIRFGASRLAVRENNESLRPGCVYCGLCLYGCPHELIYNSAHVLDILISSGKLKLIQNMMVTSVKESKEGVQIHAISLDKKEPTTFRGKRVFLACGVLSTTKILLSSLKAYNKKLRLYDSQYFIFPLIRFKGTSAVDLERLHSLAQVFIEIDNNAVNDKTVHLQIYTYNTLFEEALHSMLGQFYKLFKFPLKLMLKRLLLVQGYLHSDSSSAVFVTLKKNDIANGGDVLSVSFQTRNVTTNTIKKLISFLNEHKHLLGSIALKPMLRVSGPGKSYHFGGTFPMRKTPGSFESDVLGRPSGFRRVHAVDATIFPTIPATTITFTVMANAHRIGSLSGSD